MEIPAITTFNLGILVLFLGKYLNSRVGLLRQYNIPEPVSSGLLICLLTWVIYLVSGLQLTFDLKARDILLVFFFAGIGLNSDIRKLISGGLPLVILVVATVVLMMLQNLTGVGVASLFGLEKAVGVLGGTTSLIGGHGTAIAWTPTFRDEYGITNASEMGVACATFGLILASVVGGPIANFLITRKKLEPEAVDQPDVGLAHDDEETQINVFSFLAAWLVLNVSLSIGYGMQEGLAKAGLQLPLFVCCLFAAIILTNTIPRIFPNIIWPSGTRSLALISDICLGMFLAMSMMSLQLWTLADLAGPIFAILAAQVLMASAFTLFIVFRVMGSDYEAAVICSGFFGYTMGATPTAMANMTAVSKKYGAAHKAFIIVPLVCGFFVDIANAVLIKSFLQWFG